jgi:hypothetical protein
MKVLGIMKMNKIIGFSLLAASFQATAASTDLTITGEITETACNIGFDQQATFGDIQNNELLSGKGTRMRTTMDPTLTISCSTPSLVGLRLMDNRADSKAPHRTDVGMDNTAKESGEFGLGFDSSGNKIGYWAYNVLSTQVDGEKGQSLKSTNGGASWGIVGSEWGGGGENYLYSFNKPSQGTTPSAVNTVNMKIGWVTAIFVPREELNTASEINLDGSVTFELFYF